MKKTTLMTMIVAIMLLFTACSNTGTTEEGTTEEEQTAITENDTAENTDESTESIEEEKEKIEPTSKILKLLGKEDIQSLATWKAVDSMTIDILGNLNSGLYTVDINGVAIPEVAESVEISEDGLTYTFKIRDVNWYTSEGEEYDKVKASDFVYSWKKLLDPSEKSGYASILSVASIVNGKEAVDIHNKISTYEASKIALEKISVDNFTETPRKSAETQYEEALQELQGLIEMYEADFDEKYGSIDGAYTELENFTSNLGIVAQDDTTFVVKLASPVPYFLELMTSPTLFPANETFVKANEVAYGTTKESFLYNGSFIMTEWTKGVKYKLSKNVSYWDRENVGINGIEYFVKEDLTNAEEITMYTEGEIMSVDISGENVIYYQDRNDVVKHEITELYYLALNQGKGEETTTKNLLKNSNMRKAINMAINKKYITEEILKDGSIPADYIIPKGFGVSEEYSNADFRTVAGELYGGKEGYNLYNVEKAKELWNIAKTELGFNQVTMELLVYLGEPSATIGAYIESSLEGAFNGLDVEIQAITNTEKRERSLKGAYELNWTGWRSTYPDAMNWLEMWVANGRNNITGYTNEEYDRLVASVTSGDISLPGESKKRFESLITLEKILLQEDQVIIPLYQKAGISLINPKVSNLKQQNFGPTYIFKWVAIEE